MAEGFDESHRKALVGVGILPLQFISGQTAHGLKLTGREKFTFRLDTNLSAKQQVTITVSVVVLLFLMAE